MAGNKAPDLRELQAAMVDTSHYELPEDEEEEKPSTTKLKLNDGAGGKLGRGWNRFLAFLHELPELLRRIADIILNVISVAAVVAVVAVVSVLGDRLYLQYTDTGSSRFEAFLKERGYHEQALAFHQQNDICQDKRDALNVCAQTAYLYMHPEIPIWPDKTKTANAMPPSPIAKQEE